MNFDLSDFLVAEIAVVDPTGAIAHCNRKWEETARIGMLAPKQPELELHCGMRGGDCNETVARRPDSRRVARGLEGRFT